MVWVQRLPLLFPFARNKQKLVITTHNSSWSFIARLELSMGIFLSHNLTMMLLKRNWVMLVDDEIDIVGLFSEVLTMNGINVHPFTDPEEALQDFEINHDRYALVISDVKMKPISGIEFIKKLRELDSKIKVIMMTAFEIDGNQLKQLDNDEFFNKPIRINDLVQIVKKYVY
jgi:DNA-binding NtrC family response regulator